MRNYQLFLTVATFVAFIGSVFSSEYDRIKIKKPEKEIGYHKSENKKNKGSGPLTYAVPVKVDRTLNEENSCVSVHSEGATNLNFHFNVCNLGSTCKLSIRNGNGKISGVQGIKVDSSACVNGELWTSMIASDTADICVEKCSKEEEFEVHLDRVFFGFVDFAAGNSKSGSCNIDVVCPESIGWEKEVSSVAGVSFGGSLFCTGAMINNMEEDQTPYFLTANHCGINAGNAASFVPYWNFETSVCGGNPDGVLNQSTLGGAVHLASTSAYDATLLRLNNSPDPSYGVSFAGWDKSPVAYEVLPGVAIHHPSGDEKRISFENNPMSTTSYLSDNPIPSGSHVKVEDWDVGTTEPGSSGSPLFNGNHRIIGQLHGGYAACGNNLADWYGRFSQSWDAANFAQWLDPNGVTSGSITGIDTLDPYAFPTISPAPSSPPPPTQSPTICEGVDFGVNLQTDNYASETSFELADEAGNIVFSGSNFQDNTLYNLERCLSGECYEFTINDSYGDGICCAWGDGYYTLVLDGTQIASGGAFDYSETTSFCVDEVGECVDSPLPIVLNSGSTKTCNEVEQFCQYQLISSHCPLTCSSCGTFCEDSQADWRIGSYTVDCEFVAGYNGANDLCGFSDISITCAGTCGHCNQ